jgi:hypothetical protein
MPTSGQLANAPAASALLASCGPAVSRRAVGLAASDTNDTRLALNALQMAVRDRNPAPGLIYHSDPGSPYASGEYRDALTQICAVASMSSRGDCWDNARVAAATSSARRRCQQAVFG